MVAFIGPRRAFLPQFARKGALCVRENSTICDGFSAQDEPGIIDRPNDLRSKQVGLYLSRENIDETAYRDTPMKVLVLGCGGMIGDATAHALAERGATVVRASRHGWTGERGKMLGIRADRNDAASVRGVIAGHGIDVLIDVVAYAPEETQRLLAQIDGTVGQYVLLSSLDVYRNYGLIHRIETGRADTGPLDEDAPVRTRLYPYRADPPRAPDAADAWLDHYDKIPIENLARGLTIPSTVLRLPMVFGPADRQHRFRWAIGPMLANAERLDLPPAWLDWTSTYGFIDNVAAAIAATAGHSAAYRQTFNVTDTDPVAHRVWLDRFRDHSGWRGDLRETADASFPGGDGVAALDLGVPLAVTGHKLRDALAFEAPVSLRRALEETIAYERETGADDDR